MLDFQGKMLDTLNLRGAPAGDKSAYGGGALLKKFCFSFKRSLSTLAT
jgi:glutamate synthase domain-containing protein 1